MPIDWRCVVVTEVQIAPSPKAATDTAAIQARSNLSRAQFLMWLGQQIDPDAPLYNMILAFRINGAVDPETFVNAWRHLVAGSDALRTRIVQDDSAPQREVQVGPVGSVEIVDLRESIDPKAASAAWIEDRKVRPLQLDDHLWDCALIRLTDDATIWYLCQHHLITDGQSYAVVYEAMTRLYDLAAEGLLDSAPQLPPFEAYVDYERSAMEKKSWAKADGYWHGQIAEDVEATALYGRSVDGRSARTDRLVVELDQRRSNALREIARSPGFEALTPDLSLHAIWATLLFTALHRIGGEDRLRIGSPYLGRPTATFRKTIGLFIEIGVLNATIEPGDTFETLGRRVLDDVITGMLHAKPGVSSAVLNRSYDVLLNSVTSRFERFAGHEVTTDWVHTGYGDRDHALRLQVADFDTAGTFRLHFDVNAELFTETERAWLLDQFDAVVDRFIDDPGGPLGGFDLLSEPDRVANIVDFNDTDASYPDTTVVDLFLEQVATTPTAVAVEDADGAVTYTQLAAMVEAVSTAVTRAGAGPGSRVAVCARRSRHVVAAILGAMKCGAAYVPIDPAFPADRRALMIDDCQAAAVLTDGAAITAHDPALADTAVIDITDLASAHTDSTGPQSTTDSADPLPEGVAYMIYTSGSTGRPKGTVLTHRGLVNYLWWARGVYLGDGPGDFALYSSLSFDLTITSLFLPLISGGRIVTYDHHGSGAGLEILDVFDEDRVDVVKLTPAHLAMLREHGISTERISTLIVGGENFRTELASDIDKSFPAGVRIFNEYGPTEAVVGCMIHRYDPELDRGPSVPIGRPAANARIHVVDRYDQPVPPGVIGEMVIGSDGVALGYWNRPDLTNERFGSDPNRAGARWYRTGDLARWDNEGQLEFLGRLDHQVKIRGARIELGEIETALLEHPAVDDVVVDVVTNNQAFAGPEHHCTVCGLPSNYPGAGFDDNGVCDDCQAYERHRADVDRYWRTPDDLTQVLNGVKAGRNERSHDCIVLVSGGKDSTYMLYQLVRRFGVRPLVFTLDNGFISEAALDNVRAACADLDVDLHVATTPHMNAIFADSLDRHANVCDGCFKTVYTLSMMLARDRGIDTIVTGLARGQLFETRLADTFAAREFDPEAIDAWIMEARKAYHHIEDAAYRLLDNSLFDTEDVFEDVGFVDFYRYVDVGLDEVYGYLDNDTIWTRPDDTGRSTNCLINDVGIYVHKKTRGFHNYALPYSWDVRLGHKHREAAMDELDDDIDVVRVREILDEIGFDRPLADARSEKRLAAYVTTSVDVATADLRQHLSERLPHFMVPSFLVPLDELPLTVNGKVDRAALPDPGAARPEMQVGYLAPRNDVENRLAVLWSEVLDVPEVGVNDNFFDLGGDSITSIQIVAAAAQLGLRFSARDIFSNQTVAELATKLDEADPEDEAGLVVPDSIGSEPSVTAHERMRIGALMADVGGWEAVEDVYPLTPTQAGMLYHSLSGGESDMYVGQGVCRFDQPVDAARFRQAWNVVCQANPATRARFAWTGLDQPMQVIQREVAFPWEHHDWRELGDNEAEAALEGLAERQRRAGFRLDGTAMMAFTLAVTNTGTHFIWNSHHALLDGWSAYVLFSQVLETYDHLGRNESGAEAPALAGGSFKQHVQWLSSRDTPTARQWWSEQLAGVDIATPLPFESTIGDGNHASTSRVLELGLSTTVTEFTRQHRLTLSTLVNGAWALALSHYSGADDVLFGATVSGRDDTPVPAKTTVGMFIATLPVRMRIDAELPVGQWLQAAQDAGLTSREHGQLALTDLQRFTTIPAAEPMFESIVVVENYPAMVSDGGSTLAPDELRIAAPSNYPLALLIHPGDRFRLEAVYDEGRVSQATAEHALRHLQTALESLIVDVDRRLGDIEVVDAAEEAEVRRWEQGPLVEAPSGWIHEQIINQARRFPDHVAVRSGPRSLSYGRLDALSRAFGHGLTVAGVKAGDCVGVAIGDDPQLIAAIVGILRVGATYVPLDPGLPATRLAHIVGETKTVFVIAATDDERLNALSCPVMALDTISLEHHSDLEHRSDLDIGIGDIGSTGETSETTHIESNDPAYIIYTSGSTARPKGVVVTHGNIAHSTGVRDSFYGGGGVDTFLLLSSLAFDSSMVGLFWTLCGGGTLVIPPTEQRHTVRYLCGVIEEQRVTHLLALPSLYAVLLDEAAPNQFDSLETVAVAGEACPVGLIKTHRTRMGETRLFNEYGPTEGSVWSHACRLDDLRPDAGVPIGGPIPNVVSIVLDHLGRRCGVGVAGELFIGGPGVALGYLDQPEATAAAFVVDPCRSDPTSEQRWYRTGDLVRWRADGKLDFLGRRDGQVKLRGHRIELGEVEAALVALDSIADAVVGVDDSGLTASGDRRRLVAHYVPSENNGLVTEAQLVEELSDQLPRYMIPSVFVAIDEMPTTATGKIDRSRLPIPEPIAERTGEQPLDSLERRLASIWSSVLKVETVNRNSDFFELGGNSLDAMRMFARIEQSIGRDLPLDVLFTSSTIATLADALRSPTPSRSAGPLVAIAPDGFKRPFFYVAPYEINIVEVARLARHFDADRPFFGLQPSGLGAGEPIDESIESMASRYIEHLKAVQPTGPYLIGGHCDGGWIAFEMAVQLREQGDIVSYLGLADIPPPPDQLPTEGAIAATAGRLRYYYQDRRLYYALQWKLRLWLENKLLFRFGPARWRRVRQVRQVHNEAHTAYSFRHDERTPLHLIRSTELADIMDGIDWYGDLQAGNERVEVTDIESTHARLLLEPETSELARALSSGLDRADEEPAT